jgi:hypothetical protein
MSSAASARGGNMQEALAYIMIASKIVALVSG